jgi:hypothetical protein
MDPDPADPRASLAVSTVAGALVLVAMVAVGVGWWRAPGEPAAPDPHATHMTVTHVTAPHPVLPPLRPAGSSARRAP